MTTYSVECSVIIFKCQQNFKCRIEGNLKGVWRKIFDFRFYLWISVPQAPKYSIGAVLNFFPKFAEIFANEYVVDTGDKLFSGVNDTGEKHTAD